MKALQRFGSAGMLAILLALPLGAQPPAERDPAKSSAEKVQKKDTAEKADAGSEKPKATEVPADLETEGMVALEEDGGVWMDRKRKWVVIDGNISVQRGTLEMFACPKQTKEHESVVAVDAKASVVHAALIAVGARPGKPSSFVDGYEPVSGPEVEVWVLWKDAEGKPHKARAQEWVRNVKTGKQMDVPWIFGGSKVWTNPNTGERYYQGDGGDFICVSNFPTATLDVPVPSTQSSEGLLYEAFTERVPEPGTKVRLVLVPKVEQDKEDKEPDNNEEENEENDNQDANPDEKEPRH